MTEKNGITDKVYSPYSAFVAMLLSALLAKDSTKQELLRCLQFEDVNADANVIAAELTEFLLASEFCTEFYNPEFDRVIESIGDIFGSKVEAPSACTKTQFMAYALSQFGSLPNIITVLEAALQEKQKPDFKVWDNKNENTSKLRPLFQKVQELVYSNFTIAGANRLWPNAKLNLDMSEFAILTEKMKMRVTPVEFPQPGVDQINADIAELTNNLIKDLLSPDAANEDTSCILTNAIYFNAKWVKEFKSDKIPVDWTMLDGSVRKVDLMPVESTLKVHEAVGATFVSVPYRGCDYSMIIALPNEKGEAALRALAAAITPTLLSEVANTQTCEIVDLRLPKFTCRWGSASLKDMLVTLGAHEIFTTKAKFVARSYVSDVVQQAVIKVNESGTEAAAATAVMIELCCLSPPPSRSVVCDHPFLYFIRNEANGCILFMGSCLDPKPE